MADVGDFPAVAALVIFCLAIVFTLLLVFKAVRLRIPLRGRNPLVINVKYYMAPVAAVLAMLACTSMSIRDVGRGLLGNSQIQPYGILILFMSMAYIAGALDATGVFAWLALKFTAMSGGRGRVLFLFYFLLSSFITTFTSNDVCILTLTPIVCYFAKATGVDPMPFLFAEYAAANTFGALLYTGNPTNIIVADAYNMTFLGYSKYMTLPTFAAGIVCFAMLLLEFHSSIPAAIPLPAVDASHMLRDKLGAVLGSINMLTCLGLLAAAPSLGWAMWAITLVCAGVHCVYNVWAFRSSLTHVPIGECWTCGGAAVDEGGREHGYCGGSEEEGCAGGCTAAHVAEGPEAAGHAAAKLVLEEEMKPGKKAQQAETKANGRGCGQQLAAVRQPAGLSARSGCCCAQNRATSGATAVATGAVAVSAGASREDWALQSTSTSSGNGGGTKGGCGRRCGCSASSVGGDVVAAGGSHPACCSVVSPSVSPSDVGCGMPDPLAVPGTAVMLALAPETAVAAAGAKADGEMEGEQVPVAPAMTVDSLRGKAPTFWSLFFDLPWEVVPFALGMFVLVEGLHVQGWLDVFGSGLGRGSTSLPAAVFIMGFLSVALANTINNQPMTILLTRVALDARFTAHVGHGNTHKAALFALVLGSNIGAVFTVIGALAGILWSNIMNLHGRTITYTHFARVCCPVGFMTLAASLLVLWFEFAVFPHDD